ncbi:hypothetical protein O181_110155 [Austropuccinia psidii MF-1]|uniref:Uncharacterized protein n=1 Tax=Austropuccinia psidii MF-1 TaxID=1389203 RepID=A0A9Q3PR87_9BASI|nr:hypothetical protein [Austropuccinia psidii MF-1]
MAQHLLEDLLHQSCMDFNLLPLRSTKNHKITQTLAQAASKINGKHVKRSIWQQRNSGLTEEDESKAIKSMREKIGSMCPCYSEMDVIFGKKPNVTPIASYDLKEKDSSNGDDDDDVLLDKNNGLESPLNMVIFLHNKDDLVQVENLQDESVTHETSENACLEWERERWNEEKESNMEKQQFEEVKFQKQMEFDEKQHTEI